MLGAPALQYNDHKKLYLAALGIFSGSGRAELSEQVLKTMTKKFNTSCKVWMKAVEAALAKDPQGEVSEGCIAYVCSQGLRVWHHPKSTVTSLMRNSVTLLV